MSNYHIDEASQYLIPLISLIATIFHPYVGFSDASNTLQHLLATPVKRLASAMPPSVTLSLGHHLPSSLWKSSIKISQMFLKSADTGRLHEA